MFDRASLGEDLVREQTGLFPKNVAMKTGFDSIGYCSENEPVGAFVCSEIVTVWHSWELVSYDNDTILISRVVYRSSGACRDK